MPYDSYDCIIFPLVLSGSLSLVKALPTLYSYGCMILFLVSSFFWLLVIYTPFCLGYLCRTFWYAVSPVAFLLVVWSVLGLLSDVNGLVDIQKIFLWILKEINDNWKTILINLNCRLTISSFLGSIIFYNIILGLAPKIDIIFKIKIMFTRKQYPTKGRPRKPTELQPWC